MTYEHRCTLQRYKDTWNLKQKLCNAHSFNYIQRQKSQHNSPRRKGNTKITYVI